MTIAVIDQGAELYWFVSSALIQDEYHLKHLKTIQTGEQYILQDLPSIVILNGDDASIPCEKFIAQIRNHVFARNTLFIVFTADTSLEYKKSLIIAGAGQIFYHKKGHNPSPKFFRNLVKWFLNLKKPEKDLIEFKPVAYPKEGEFSTFGRVGWIDSENIYIEINLDLSPGQSLQIKNPLFTEMDIKDIQVTVIEKNPTGRYYQYSNGYLCKLTSKKFDQDQKKIKAFIESNQEISKYKPVKVVYYEQSAPYREELKSILKLERKYCARGFANLDNFSEELQYQQPHLVLIDRAMIEKSPSKFEAIKEYLKKNLCVCVTYDSTDSISAEAFKNKFEFAMHIPGKIDGPLLESMIERIENKILSIKKDDTKDKIYFNKYSPYSKMSLHTPCHINQLAISGVGIEIPFAMTSYCAFEISSHGFAIMGLNRTQFFRSFINRVMSDGKVYHQCVFIGQTILDNDFIKSTIEKINELGLEKWKLERST